jgi:hypothetical protein
MNPDGQVEPITTDELHLESGSPYFKEERDENMMRGKGGGVLPPL